MRKLLKKRVSLFGKEISVFFMAVMGVAVFASAALIPYFGQIIGTAGVSQGLVLDGGSWDVPIEVEFEGLTSLEEATRSSSHQLVNEADEAIALFSLVSSCEAEDEENDCDGIATGVKYPLEAGQPQGSEDRVVISADEAGISSLDGLNSMSWEVIGGEGYAPHVDVFLDNGETLVFEYAKVDPTQCDNSENYPTGDFNTFADKGIVDSGAYAWLSSGPPGPCGNATFNANHKSLADWKAEYPDAEILRFELEVDSWISESSCSIMDVEINGESVTGSYLAPGETLNFTLVHDFAKLLMPDTYTITTNVEPAGA